MVRPSSKIMADKSAPDTSPTDAVVKNTAPVAKSYMPDAKPAKPAKPPKAEVPKVDVRAQKAALKEALAKARAPLTEREATLKGALKALTEHDKMVGGVVSARMKAIAVAEKEHTKVIAGHDKTRKGLLKAHEAATFSVQKATDQYAKGEAKINERIAALTPPKV